MGSAVNRRSALVVAVVLALPGCGYFNSLYNARREFADAERAAATGQESQAQQGYTGAIEKAGFKPELAEVTMRPENTIELAGEDAAKMQKLLDVLEDLDDVQDVFHNAAIQQ